MEQNKGVLPIFFAVDDGYIPFLAVTLQSLVDNSSAEYYYLIKILYTNISKANKEKIKKYEKNNINIEFVDLNDYIEEIKDKLYTRDYYSKTTYFRLFIPSLYPEYDKALYLDCDIILLKDVADLFNIDLGDNLVGGAPDDVIQTNEVFQEYAEKVVGVSDYRNYFNAGVLLMNLDQLRRYKFQEKFLYVLGTIKFSVAQDQDYLNRLCKGRVKIIDKNWNRMPISGENVNEEELKLIHYNLISKPWHYDDILYKEYFWRYAKRTEYYNKILEIKRNYTDQEKFEDMESNNELIELAKKESDCVGDDRRGRNMKDQERKKSKDRLEILEKIQKLEKEGHFDVDAEEDPPTVILTPENVDYLNRKWKSKIKTIVANKIGERFLDRLLDDNKLIIKEIRGIEILQKVQTGAMITCNHFNPFDSFSIEETFRISGQSKNKTLYKVIREGNYTNFPGLYGFFFRNCNTLPLSSNTKTMSAFIKAVDTILQRGDFILIYPEQSLWWNYKKPKPLKNGAFRLASRNNVPVIPIFITMEDTDIIGEDGFPVQQYIINIEEPIYPDKNLTTKENTQMMKEKNFEVWKKVYEDFYKIPLEYTTVKEAKKDLRV